MTDIQYARLIEWGLRGAHTELAIAQMGVRFRALRDAVSVPSTSWYGPTPVNGWLRSEIEKYRAATVTLAEEMKVARYMRQEWQEIEIQNCLAL